VKLRVMLAAQVPSRAAAPKVPRGQGERCEQEYGREDIAAAVLALVLLA
jgi:hypothetical protein